MTTKEAKTVELILVRRHSPAGCRTEQAADNAARDEREGQGPDDEAGCGMAEDCCKSECGHRHQRGTYRAQNRHRGRGYQARHDQKASADAEESRKHARPETEADDLADVATIALPALHADRTPPLEHHGRDSQHQESEKEEQYSVRQTPCLPTAVKMARSNGWLTIYPPPALFV